MPRTRKHHWWDVEIRGKTARVRSKTYGGAVHKAKKVLKVNTLEADRDGGFVGVKCELSKQ